MTRFGKMSRRHGPETRGNISSARNTSTCDGSSQPMVRVPHRRRRVRTRCPVLQLICAFCGSSGLEPKPFVKSARICNSTPHHTNLSPCLRNVGSSVEGLMTSCILVFVDQIFASSARSRGGMPPAPNFFVIYNCTDNDFGTAQPMRLD
jgi:hypothetical protein